jgi:hypothetical protein
LRTSTLEQEMRRTFCFAGLLGLAMSCKAQIVGGMADVAVVDRDSGAVLSPHYYRGEYWVAGRPGARYSIQIRNRLGERLLAVTSVDGVNVVTGATAGFEQSGYVFGPGESYQITGWRKTDSEVAAFTFTESANSYAERTGRPANVGVIGVAIFRERRPEPAYVPPMIARPTDDTAQSMAKAQAGTSSGRAANATDAAADARLASAAPGPNAPNVAWPAAVAPKLGTGHGEREYSYVNHTDFARMQTQPNEVIRIRYDSLERLFAMGVIKRPRPASPTANPFPASPGEQYVPDPAG